MIDLDAFIAKLPNSTEDDSNIIRTRVKERVLEAFKPIVDEGTLEWHIHAAMDSSSRNYYRNHRGLGGPRQVVIQSGGLVFRANVIKLISELNNKEEIDDNFI